MAQRSKVYIPASAWVYPGWEVVADTVTTVHETRKTCAIGRVIPAIRLMVGLQSTPWPMLPTVFHSIGLYGFGAAAHILIQVARYRNQEIYAFTRDEDTEAQSFARELGAIWAGGSSESAPVALDGAIIFAPAGELVPQALRAVRKGGRVVCAGIHMSDIPSFPYDILWGEREICSVANLTRRDGEEFLPLAAQIPVQTTVHPYPLEQANQALDDLRDGLFNGAAVLLP